MKIKVQNVSYTMLIPLLSTERSKSSASLLLLSAALVHPFETDQMTPQEIDQ